MSELDRLLARAEVRLRITSLVLVFLRDLRAFVAFFLIFSLFAVPELA